MRVSDFDDFDSLETQGLLAGSKERSWLWFGLIVSLGLHFALCTYFYRTRFQSVEAVFAQNQQTPTFNVRNIDESKLDKTQRRSDKSRGEAGAGQHRCAVAGRKEIIRPALTGHSGERGAAGRRARCFARPAESGTTGRKFDAYRDRALDCAESRHDPNATRDQSLLNNSSASGRPQPALSGTELATSTTIKRPNTFTSKMPGDSAGPNKGRAPGFSDLDQLLAQKGPLGSGTKLRMPDDQLFEYDSDVLQASAVGQLQKLGTLIQRNPKATFSVEGYTDSFGTPEYNFDLSQRRADSVKRYLVEAMGISPVQIQTRGYGATKFRSSPNGSIEEQSPNRRVEIVVHTSEG